MISVAGGAIGAAEHRIHADEAEHAKQRNIRRHSNAASTRRTHRLDYVKNPFTTIKKLCDFQDAFIDPYIKVAIMPWQVFGQTRHIEDHKDGEELAWNEELVLAYPLDHMHEHDCTVVVQAWDDDVGVDDLIGQGFVDPEDIRTVLANPNKNHKIKCELTDHQEDGAGVVFLEFTWIPHPEPDHTGEKHVKWHKGGPTLGDFKVLVTKAKDLRNPSKEISTAEEDKKLQIYATLTAVGYFGAGAIVFNSNCLANDKPWTFVDTLYFGIVTITTTGYGDLLPNSNYCNNPTMVFTCFYAFIGVGLIASLMGFIVGSILEKRHTMSYFVDAMKGAAPDPEKKAEPELEVNKKSWNPLNWVPFKFRATVKAFGYWLLVKLFVVIYFCHNDSHAIDPDSDTDAWGSAGGLVGLGGSEGCPCLNNNSHVQGGGMLSPGKDDDGKDVLKFTSNATVYDWPVDYGKTCGAWDMALQPGCADGAGNLTASSCQDNFCYVDVDNCDATARSSTVFSGADNVYFSKATCVRQAHEVAAADAHAADEPDDDGWHYCASNAIPECSNYCAEEDFKACADGSCDQCVANMKQNFLTPLDAVYMVSVSMTSVGYGDLSPSSQAARGFTIFWLLIGTLFVGKAFGAAADHFLQYHQEKLNAKNMSKEYDHKQIMKLDEDSSGEVNEVEFVSHMLVKSKVVDQLTLTDLRQRFKELDKSGDGFIGEEDLEEDEI